MIEEKSCVSKVRKSYGSYVFRIEGFSEITNRVGESVESPEFSLCEYLWQMRIFPNGSLEQHKGYLSFYLASKSNRVARANYTLRIVNQTLSGEDESFSSTSIRIFEPKGEQVDGWGRDRFINVEMLKDANFGLCIEDVVIFKVEIVLFGELEHFFDADSDSCSNSIRRNSLGRSMRAIFNERAYSDVKFIICGEEKRIIYAHRCILMARSEAFKIMLSCGMRECCTGEIFVEDFDYDIIYQMVLFIYTDIHPEKKIMTQYSVALLRASKKYQIQALTELCETYLFQYLQSSSVLAMLRFADACHCESLKQKCLLFIAQKRFPNPETTRG